MAPIANLKMASTPVLTSISSRYRCIQAGLLAALLMLPALAWSVAPQAVVLMYHRVGNSDYPSTNVTVEQFRAHLDYLAENDFNVLPLERIVEALRTREPLPARSVAITFDDGYASVGEVAHPLLAERGWPYTVFVNTGPVDSGYNGYLSWDAMRALADEGARFGNHSESHRPLFERDAGETRSLWRERVRADLARAQTRLAEELGAAAHQSPALLAYPFGEYSIELMDLAAEMGFVAFGQQSGAVGEHANTLALPRYAMNERFAEMDGFITKVHSAPMPVVDQSPLDPVRTEARAPQLTVTLAADADITPAQVTCFYGAEVLQPQVAANGQAFSVQGEADLPIGRSRYNCTAPNPAGGFYWFSHLWIFGPGGS